MAINLDEPRYSEATFFGRFRNFWGQVSRPRNFLATNSELYAAKKLVDDYQNWYRNKFNQINFKTDSAAAIDSLWDLESISEEKLWDAKNLVDSAFHPDTGDIVFAPGRMSYQIPVNTAVCGCMVYFRHTIPQLMFWQFANQTVNFMVNYCNRSAAVQLSDQEMIQSYLLATSSSWAVALGMNMLIKNPHGLMHRLVPFFAGAGPQLFNVGFVRKKELSEGIPLYEDREMKKPIKKQFSSESETTSNLIKSESGSESDAEKFLTPAYYGATMVWLTRVAMAAPSVGGTALIMDIIEKNFKNSLLKSRKSMILPVTLLTYASTVTISTPFGLSIWPRIQEIKVGELSKRDQEKLVGPVSEKFCDKEKILYYNKGL